MTLNSIKINHSVTIIITILFQPPFISINFLENYRYRYNPWILKIEADARAGYLSLPQASCTCILDHSLDAYLHKAILIQ